MDLIASVGGARRATQPVGGSAREQGPDSDRSQQSGPVADVQEPTGEQASARQAEVLEQFHAQEVQQGKRGAKRATAPKLRANQVDTEGLSRARELSTNMVAALSYVRPPARGRQVAADQGRALQDNRERQVENLSENLRGERELEQRRAEAAYREAAGLSADARMS